MTETQTVGLAAWLTRIWDGEEASAQLSIEITERAYPAGEFNVRWKWARLTEHKTSGGGGQSFEPGAPSPQQVLARIVADRKILELHSAEPHPLLTRSRVEPYPSERLLPVCGECSGVDDPYIDQVAWPCMTLRLLASPYADRPGFREEWRA